MDRTTPAAPATQIALTWRRPQRVWAATGYVTSGMFIGTVAFAVVLSLLTTAASLLVTFVFAVPVAWLMFVTARGFARAERARTEAMLGTPIADGVPPLTADGWLRRLWERTRTGARWREVAHAMLRFPVNLIGFALTVAVWCGSAALVGLPAYVDRLPGGVARFGLFEVGSGRGSVIAAAVGAIGLALLVPPVTAICAAAEGAFARLLLEPRGTTVLRAEVDRLETRRSAAVDSAEAERRRIERDLHDGAQQRLVALAADLGAAREKLDTDPAAAKALIATAHDESKSALQEIRDLVRGIHPVILEDRGLDAALSAIVARSPVPVELDVGPMERPPAAVESAAYFIVSEALANAARHSQAERVHVAVARAAAKLVVEIRDDGVGGIDERRGTGMRGIRDRAAALGGSVVVISPLGGPTTISVELPCAS